MTDDRGRDVAGGDRFDDERLLSLALGLEDDTELEAAAAQDDALRRRLVTARAEVAEFGARLDAAVPSPDAAYTDLRDERWAGLRELLVEDAPRPARVRRGASRRLRVLAPVAALVLAVAVGLTVVTRQAADDQALRSSTAVDEAAPTLAGGGATKAASPADAYELIVVARARATDGAVQRFAVVRTLKGVAPDVLRLRVADRPAAAGTLQLLLLSPTGERSGGASPAAAEDGASAEAYGALSGSAPLAFTYRDAPALALELPADTDPSTVVLP